MARSILAAPCSGMVMLRITVFSSRLWRSIRVMASRRSPAVYTVYWGKPV